MSKEEIYKVNPYILVNKEGVIMDAGTKKKMQSLQSDNYYSDCTIGVRKHNLYQRDNTLVKSI